MSVYYIEGQDLTNIADAIRNKTGLTESLSIEEMPREIESITTGIQLPELGNEATSEELFLNKELIDSEGNVVVGNFTVEQELSEQEELVEQITTALAGKIGTIKTGDGVNYFRIRNESNAYIVCGGFVITPGVEQSIPYYSSSSAKVDLIPIELENGQTRIIYLMSTQIGAFYPRSITMPSNEGSYPTFVGAMCFSDQNRLTPGCLVTIR